MKRMHKANVIKLNSSFLCMEIIEAAYSAALAKRITAQNYCLAKQNMVH